MQVLHFFFFNVSSMEHLALLWPARIYDWLSVKSLCCQRSGSCWYRDGHGRRSSEKWFIKDFCVLFRLAENNHIRC